MAAAMPAKVLSLDVILMTAEDEPTPIVKLPVPTTLLAEATGAEVNVAAVARFCTDRL